jgi:tetratricopeptide (TPR) repeat protein
MIGKRGALGVRPTSAARRPLLYRRTVAVLAGAILVLVGFGGMFLFQRWSSAREYQAARQAYENGNFAEAQRLLGRFLNRNPHDGNAHLLAARVARRRALKTNEGVTWLDEAHQHLSQAERSSGDPESIGLERAILAVQEQAASAAASEQQLMKYVQQGHFDSPLMLEALSTGFRRTRRFPRALYCLDKLLGLQPDNAWAHFMLGCCFDELSQPAVAIAAYEKVIEIDPENAEARLRLVDDLIEYRRTQDALVQLRFLRQRLPENAAVLVGLGTCLHTDNQLVNAERSLRAALAIEPANAKALTELGKIQLELGQLDEAEQHLRRAVAAAPYARRSLFALYQCLEQAAKEVEANECLARYQQIDADLRRLRTLQQSIMTAPHDADRDYEAGTLCLRNGLPEEGIHWLKSALRENPVHVGARQALADYYAVAGEASSGSHRATSKEGANRSSTMRTRR